MDCDAARLAISSRADDEPVADDGAIAEHLAQCGPCRDFERRIGDLAPRPVRAVSSSDALSQRVLGALEPDRSTAPESRFLRIALGIVGVLAFVQALPELVGPGSGRDAHMSRHLGVFTAALAVGFVYTALRPRRVGGLLPVAAVISGGLVVTAAIDVASGLTPVAGEATHILEIVGLAVMWMLTRIERPRRAPRHRSPRGLRPVPDDGAVRPDPD